MELFGTRNKFALIIAVFSIIACQEVPSNSNKMEGNPNKRKATTPKKEQVKVPYFSSDSAYQYIVKQLDFGPRTNNSEAHVKCGNYLEKFFKDLGLTVYSQEAMVTAHDGKNLNFKNIIAQHNPQYGTRIFISAHWDSRPWADAGDKDKDKPILAANDGGSGVAIIMELARIISENKSKVGIDFILWDAEDYGKPSVSETYCLGSQYWAKNKIPKNYHAKYGINLDMVGGTGAIFPIEQYSNYYAPHVIKKVWTKAKKLGYESFFPAINSSGVTDDHYFISVMAGIPTIDIIHKDLNTGAFHSSWHTHDDNLDAIDQQTLQVVGEVVLGVIYDEVIR